MRSRSFLTVAVLGAALLPLSGARADHHLPGESMKGTTMDAGMFRGNLNNIKDIFDEMRENSMLALAAQDDLVRAGYENDNRRMLTRALGLIDVTTRNWKRADVPSGYGSTERWGTAEMNRYATESSDTAFVRNTIWELQSMLQAAKLNGRSVAITDEMMDMLNAAIKRAEAPDFRVVRAFDSSRLSEIQWSKSTEAMASSRTTASADVNMTGSTERQKVTFNRNVVVQNPPFERVASATTTETTTQERFGAADETLPQTGGNPGIILTLGSGLMGLGFLLRKRS